MSRVLYFSEKPDFHYISVIPSSSNIQFNTLKKRIFRLFWKITEDDMDFVTIVSNIKLKFPTHIFEKATINMRGGKIIEESTYSQSLPLQVILAIHNATLGHIDEYKSNLNEHNLILYKKEINPALQIINPDSYIQKLVETLP